jgi:hypothetical protein
MGPKKVQEEKKIPLGRPGNNLKTGIVCTITLLLGPSRSYPRVTLL